MRRVVVNSVGKVMRTMDDIDAIPGKPIQLTIDEDLQAVAEADFDEQGRRAPDRDGCAHGRSAGDGEPAHVRSQRFCRAHSAERMGRPEHRSGNAAAESRDSGAACARVGVQSRDGVGDARIEGYPCELHGLLPGSGDFLRAPLSIATTRTARWICTKESSLPATSTFTTWGNFSESTASMNTPTGLGLGQRTGIDLPGEEPGLIPSEDWSERVNHHKWYPGSTISVAIGQGADDGDAGSTRAHDRGSGERRHVDPAASFEGRARG